MKKFLCVFAAICLLLSVSACGAKKTLRCDGCNKEVQVKQSSNMEDDWILFCAECQKTLFADGPIVSKN